MNTNDLVSEGGNVISQPRFVPLGWLVAIIGASGTAILAAFSLGIFVATLSSRVDAEAIDVAKLQDNELPERMLRVETLLALAYPNEYQTALKRVPARRGH